MIPSLGFIALAAGGEEAGTAAILNVAVAGVSLVLFALSLNAYRGTKLRRMLFVAGAFFSFAVSIAIRNVEVFVFPAIDADEVLVTAAELVALLLFFSALVVKE